MTKLLSGSPVSSTSNAPSRRPIGSVVELNGRAQRARPVLPDVSRSASTLVSTDDVILVTGAGGFIGGHLVAELRRRGFSRIRAVDLKPIDQWYQRMPGVEALRADLRELDSCRQASHDVRWVFNLAADMGGMGFIETNRAACMLSVLINTNLLLAARELGVERLFFSSSACVYNAHKQDRTDVVALREEDAYPALPEDGYGWEKLFSKRMCRHFSEDFALATRVARYHNVYGPLGTWDGGREKAPAAICRKVAQAKLTGKSDIEIWGNGRQTETHLYRRLRRWHLTHLRQRLRRSSEPRERRTGLHQSARHNDRGDSRYSVAATL